MDKFSGKFADRANDDTYVTKEDREHAALISIALSLEELVELVRAGVTIKVEEVVKVEEQPVWPSTPVVT